MDLRPAAQSRPAAMPDDFPPLSISSPAWLSDGSDQAFRRVIYKLLSLSSLVLRSRERFAAYIGVSGPQYSMLVVVAESGAATVSQIASALDVSGPFVTAQVGKLERGELVAKRPNAADGRSTLIVLTDLGRRLIMELAPLRSEINDMIYGSLDRAQVEQMSTIVDLLHADASRALHLLDAPERRDSRAPSVPTELKADKLS